MQIIEHSTKQINIADTAAELDARLEAVYMAAIIEFTTCERSKRSSLTAAELGNLEGANRVVALRNGVMAFLIDYCRRERPADLTIPVAIITFLLSDNRDGRCTLSSVRMAEMLGCNEKTVRRAIDRLEEKAYVAVEDRAGRTKGVSPAIHPVFARYGGSIIWMINALSEQRTHGRPRKDGNVLHMQEMFGADRIPDADKQTGQKTPDTRMSEVFKNPGHPEQKPPDTSDEKPRTSRCPTSSLKGDISKAAAAATERNTSSLRSESSAPASQATDSADVQDVRKVFNQIRSALKIIGRDYGPTPRRLAFMAQLVAERGMAYIEELIQAIANAAALRHMQALQTHRIIEDDEYRQRVIDGAYRDLTETRAPAASQSRRRAAPVPTYSAEFEAFWAKCPAHAQLHGDKPGSYELFSEMSDDDRHDANVMLDAGYWDRNDPEYVTGVLRWLQRQGWKAMSRLTQTPLRVWAREKREREVREAARQQRQEPDWFAEDEKEVLVVVPNDLKQRKAWLLQFLIARIQGDDVIQTKGDFGGGGDHLLTDKALAEMRAVVVDQACNEGDDYREFFVDPGEQVEWKSAPNWKRVLATSSSQWSRSSNFLVVAQPPGQKQHGSGMASNTMT